MSEYAFENIEKLELKDDFSDLLSEGIHIILFNPTSPPPHLLILVHGSVFSISVSGPRVNWALRELLDMVSKRKIPTLFITLDKPASVIIKDTGIMEFIHDLTLTHSSVRANEASCLFPIMEFCKTVYNIDISKVKVIFDLLDQLKEVGMINQISELNLDKWVKGGVFRISRYGEEEVNEMITNLKNK